MDNKDISVLEKILSHTQAVMRYCEHCDSLQAFQNNPMLVDATVFNLMQIGELAKMSLSDDAKISILSIPWNQIYGMRNRIVHGYDGVKMNIVWDTVSNDIPLLHDELIAVLSEQKQGYGFDGPDLSM